MLAGMVVHPLQKGKEVLKFYREYNGKMPEEMSAWAALLTTPDGHTVVAILACYIGQIEPGEEVLRPLRDFGPPMADMIQPMPYVKSQSLVDESFPRGRCNYWKSNLLRELSDEAIGRLVGGFGKVTSPYSSVLIEQLGGAVSRVGKDETAFADELWKEMQPFSSGGVYVNYLGDEGEDRVKAAYGTNYERLVALKNKYDPQNLFRFNQNIKPTVRKS